MNLSEKDIANLKLMHTHLLENPFGVWNKIPELHDNASLNESQKFDLLWNETVTEDISESEVSDYLQRLAEKSSLNEYAERGWFGISPFAWTEGFRVSSIFKPLKWLAVPLIGGTVLLLAGIWKLLKEGKKQIAIAKVRAWIEKLVVTADSGLKKTRNTKDSLFLIRQRYRRDILQNAVKVATCLGFDIPEKDDKPSSVETSLNESSQYYDPKKAIIITDIKKPGYKILNDNGTITFKKGNINIEYNYFVADDQKLYTRKYYDNFLIPDNLSTNETITQDVIDVVKEIDNDIEEINKNNNWYDNKILNGEIMDLVPKDENGIQDFSKPWELSENGINVGDKRSLELNDDQTQDQTQDLGNDDTQGQGEKGPGAGAGDDIQGQGKPSHTAVLNGDTMLPDDSRVDWSLMNSVTASQWFGLKHKTTNFWKEAKSVAVIEDQQGNALRFCGLLVSQVSMSLTLIANQGVAQNYTSIMNKYIETLTNVKTSDSASRNSYSYRDDRRFSSRGMVESERAKYKMFEENFKIFEVAVTPGDNKQKISEWINDSGFVAYLKEINQYNYVMNIIMTMRDKPEVEKTSFDFIKDLYDQYSIKNVDDMVNDFNNEQQEQAQQSSQQSQQTQQSKPAGIDSSNIDKYLIAALSKVLANTDYTQWNVHADAYKQMLKFIDELTKTVHTVIDSVAKKVEEKIGGTGNTFEQAVLRFISSKPDAKQNRSLKNLWDNIGVSKLQQRTIVHCQEIDASPEMQYYLDMFMITVPSVIKSKLLLQEEKQPTDTTVDSPTNTGNGN